nr:MBL fold metallo-hydrolase [Methanomassiliicoccus luminyensis]
MVWHGHSCFEIRESIGVVTDPHDGKSIGIKPPVARADVVLISHEHFDHNCVRIIKGEPMVMREPGEKTLKGLKVTGIPTFHDKESGDKRGRNTIYVFELDGIRFCHCGDLGHLPSEEQLKAIGTVDILFLPVGGVFTLDGAEAREVVEMVRPRVAVPMHFRLGGLSISIQTVDSFLEGVPDEQVLRVGNEIDFTKEELPVPTEYWVFSQ